MCYFQKTVSETSFAWTSTDPPPQNCGLEDGGVVVEHGFADDFDGGESLAHEVVVEVFEVEGGALFLHQVGAELHDF